MFQQLNGQVDGCIMFIDSLKFAAVVVSLTKFVVTSEFWLKVGKSNGHFTCMHHGHTLSINHQIFFTVKNA
jgi:hypothetical protein